jgi:hypothetical protein
MTHVHLTQVRPRDFSEILSSHRWFVMDDVNLVVTSERLGQYRD